MAAECVGSPATQPFDFFGLPPELRDTIHELTLRPEDPRPLELYADPQSKRLAHPHITFTNRPDINWILVSRQIKAEYEKVVNRRAAIRILTDGSWDLSRLDQWLPLGVTTALLRKIQTWVLCLDFDAWVPVASFKLGPHDRLRDSQDRIRYVNVLPKLLLHQQAGLDKYAPARTDRRWEIHLICTGECISHDGESETVKDGFKFDDAKFRAALGHEGKDYRFVAHSPLYFNKEYAEESGEIKNAREVDTYLVASLEYARFNLQLSNDENNLIGWDWHFETTYTRFVSARSMENRSRPMLHGEWMPTEVYEAQ